MIQATKRRRLVRLEGELPTGWSPVQNGATELGFTGPRSIDGDAAGIRVIVEPAAEDIESTSLAVMRELQIARPGALLVNCELWPHRQWGDGRYIQSAHLDGDATFAHDIYLFVDGSRSVRIEVECPLSQLLAIEDGVATIVARLRGSQVAA